MAKTKINVVKVYHKETGKAVTCQIDQLKILAGKKGNYTQDAEGIEEKQKAYALKQTIAASKKDKK